MTGRIPYHNGIVSDQGQPLNAGMREWGIRRDLVFLPQTLKQHNYSTHMLGKWRACHLSDRHARPPPFSLTIQRAGRRLGQLCAGVHALRAGLRFLPRVPGRRRGLLLAQCLAVRLRRPRLC